MATSVCSTLMKPWTRIPEDQSTLHIKIDMNKSEKEKDHLPPNRRKIGTPDPGLTRHRSASTTHIVRFRASTKLRPRSVGPCFPPLCKDEPSGRPPQRAQLPTKKAQPHEKQELRSPTGEGCVNGQATGRSSHGFNCKPWTGKS